MLNRDFKKMKKKVFLRDLWENIKDTNICIMGVSEGEERHKWVENIIEVIAEKFPNMGKQNKQQQQKRKKQI